MYIILEVAICKSTHTHIKHIIINTRYRVLNKDTRGHHQNTKISWFVSGAEGHGDSSSGSKSTLLTFRWRPLRSNVVMRRVYACVCLCACNWGVRGLVFSLSNSWVLAEVRGWVMERNTSELLPAAVFITTPFLIFIIHAPAPAAVSSESSRGRVSDADFVLVDTRSTPVVLFSLRDSDSMDWCLHLPSVPASSSLTFSCRPHCLYISSCIALCHVCVCVCI